MATLPLSERISQGASRTRNQNIIETMYGDGYSQVAGWGENNISDEWSIKWRGLSVAERNIILDAFDNTTVWDWQAHDEGAVTQWRFTGKYRESNVGDYYNITAKIKQVFTL